MVERYSLTVRQRDCLALIERSIAERGVGPSFEELARDLGLSSKSGVWRLLAGLAERGHIRRPAGKARAVELVASRPQSPPAGSGWRPIAAAPRDGTRILIWDGAEISLAWWDQQFDCHYDAATDDTVWRGAWTDGTVADWGYQELTELRPTHFMPLPKPPVERRGASDA